MRVTKLSTLRWRPFCYLIIAFIFSIQSGRELAGSVSVADNKRSRGKIQDISFRGAQQNQQPSSFLQPYAILRERRIRNTERRGTSTTVYQADDTDRTVQSTKRRKLSDIMQAAPSATLTVSSRETDTGYQQPRHRPHGITHSNAATRPSAAAEGTRASKTRNDLPAANHPSVSIVSSSPNLVLPQVVKPFIRTSMKPHLPTFVPYNQDRVPCSQVLTEMSQDLSVSGRAYLLFNILAAVDPHAHQDPGESVQCDKEARAAMDELYRAGIETGHFGTSLYAGATGTGAIGVFGYFEKLTECDAEPATGRTLYQKLIELGMEQSCRSDLVASFLSKETKSGFNPSLVLDKTGNTLLHLAALSGSVSTFDLIVKRETEQPFLFDGSERPVHSGYYWLLGALSHTNQAGKKALDLAPTHGLRLRLKRTFRTIIHFLRKVIPAKKTVSPTFQQLINALNEVSSQYIAASSPGSQPL